MKSQVSQYTAQVCVHKNSKKGVFEMSKKLSLDEKIAKLKSRIQAISENIAREQQLQSDLQSEIDKLELNAILDAVKKSGLSRSEIIKELENAKNRAAAETAQLADAAAEQLATETTEEELTHEEV